MEQNNTTGPSSRCWVCHRGLKDPVSIALGVGPVCRIKGKKIMVGQRSIFEPQSAYDYWLDGNLLCIVDLNQGMSVTNDMERVLAKINATTPLQGKKVIYRDSDGIWDGVTFDVAELNRTAAILRVNFYHIGAKDLETAKTKIK